MMILMMAVMTKEVIDVDGRVDDNEDKMDDKIRPRSWNDSADLALKLRQHYEDEDHAEGQEGEEDC